MVLIDYDCNFFCHQVLNLKKQVQQKEQTLIEKEKKVLAYTLFRQIVHALMLVHDCTLLLLCIVFLNELRLC